MISTLVFVPLILLEFLQLAFAFPYNAFPLYRYFEEIYLGYFIQMGKATLSPHYPIVRWNNFLLVPHGIVDSNAHAEITILQFGNLLITLKRNKVTPH